jgi:L-cysteine:1D-myo-inositol 2-amino-2-deoxy-alpha-D-glucopyranoside ligase
MYVCGITPYDATHLGHAATYITYDLVHRYLKASGKSVHFVENITDIDDPLLERALRDGCDWQTLANSQIDLFIGDMTALKVIPPQE